MLILKRLYSEPEVFDEISFSCGINLILGERNATSEKTNGVGKSLSIEFISYCLLKKFKDCRVSRISDADFPHDTKICLDFNVNDVEVTSKRSISEHDSPTLIVNGNSTTYLSINDANSYLSSLLFRKCENVRPPSFRSILGPLMRDERSEFKSITNCFDTTLNIPADYAPHLYLLGIDPLPYYEAKRIQLEIDNTTKAKSKLKSDVEGLTGKSLKEARADLNDLASQVARIKVEMDQLENSDSFDLVKDELIELELQLDAERQKQSVLKTELSKLRLFKGNNYIDESEVADLYNRFKDGLGSMIQKELNEVTAFKRKIDAFQSTLIESRRENLVQSLSEAHSKIRILDSRYREKVSLIDQYGALKTLKITVLAYQRKLEEFSQLSSFIKKYDEYETQIKAAKLERGKALVLLDSLVADARPVIESVQENILEVHEYVMGNRRSYFDVKIANDKEVVKFELRIHDDGSHSNEREKVFFYDLAMLIDQEVSKRHPGMLVHDNIFDVDQDTLVRSLNYLGKVFENERSRQYILTINTDKLQNHEMRDLSFDFKKCTRASFTKSNRFLKKHYQEV